MSEVERTERRPSQRPPKNRRCSGYTSGQGSPQLRQARPRASCGRPSGAPGSGGQQSRHLESDKSPALVGGVEDPAALQSPDGRQRGPRARREDSRRSQRDLEAGIETVDPGRREEERGAHR